MHRYFSMFPFHESDHDIGKVPLGRDDLWGRKPRISLAFFQETPWRCL